jgi:hypothetical protein
MAVKSPSRTDAPETDTGLPTVVSDKGGRYHSPSCQTPNLDHLCAGRNVRLHVLIIERSQIIIDRPSGSPIDVDSHA